MTIKCFPLFCFVLQQGISQNLCKMGLHPRKPQPPSPPCLRSWHWLWPPIPILTFATWLGIFTPFNYSTDLIFQGRRTDYETNLKLISSLCSTHGTFSILSTQPSFLLCHLFHSVVRVVREWGTGGILFILESSLSLPPQPYHRSTVKPFNKSVVKNKQRNRRTKRNQVKPLVVDRSWHLLPTPFFHAEEQSEWLNRKTRVSLRRLGKRNRVEENFLWFQCKKNSVLSWNAPWDTELVTGEWSHGTLPRKPSIWSRHGDHSAPCLAFDGILAPFMAVCALVRVLQKQPMVPKLKRSNDDKEAKALATLRVGT